MKGHEESVRLRVGDARLEDVAEGRARLGRKAFAALPLKQGDVVRIAGESSILATALPAAPEDDGLDLVRLDGTQRRRLGVKVGDTVEVRHYDVKPASRIRIVTVGDGGRLELSPDDIRGVLVKQPLMAGDTIAATPRQREFYARVSVLGLNLAEVEGASSECGSVILRVVSTTPSGIVRVTENTEIERVPAGGEDHAEHPDA
jgi:transitional endoplasmic reticulum ATPase